MPLVPVTLATAAACVFLNVWLGLRIAKLRHQFKVSVGDGGNEALLRRMRAQANFIESAPFFLVLLIGLELSGGNRLALGIIAAMYIVSRIAHAIGMEGGPQQRWRAYGIQGSMIMSVLLAIWAVACAAGLCLRG